MSIELAVRNMSTPSPFMAERFKFAQQYLMRDDINLDEVSARVAIFRGNQYSSPSPYFGCHSATDRFNIIFEEFAGENVEMRIDMLRLMELISETGL